MKIALLGFGVVGSGAYEIIASQPECGITVKRALVQTMRPGPVDGLLTTDMADILDDPEIELVAEAMAGLEPAYRYVLAALRAGKHVVTANKLLVCQRFRELNQAAALGARDLILIPGNYGEEFLRKHPLGGAPVVKVSPVS